MAIDFGAIRANHPLETIVAQAVKLRRSGPNKVGCCPFHPDRSPSFVVYPETYHCFGCGAHGDVIDYVAAVEKISIPEAIRSLTGGSTPSFSPEDQAQRAADRQMMEAQQRARQEQATLEARSRWSRALPINGVGSGYLTRKNVAPYGCKREGDNLLVPIYDASGLIQSVQTIPPEEGGRKLFHAGAPVGGGRLILGDQGVTIIVVEGFATGATVQAATGLDVAIAFSKSNVSAIAAEFVDQGYEVIIGADADAADVMTALGEKLSCRVIVAELVGADGKDFNDQAAHYGLDDVAALFATPATPSEKLVHATPFEWRDTAQIPKRQWLYGKHLLRKFVSVDVAAGGVGKSSLKIGEALAMASGRDLYDKGLPEGALTVWLWNLEDPHEEIERRIHATCQR